MRVAILTDIGEAAYHVGDEAIAHGAIHQLHQRGVSDLLLLTRDPAGTRRRFGDVATARTLDLPWHPVSCRCELHAVRAFMAGHTVAPPDGVPALAATLRDVDALLIAGGGNLNSTWRWLLYERAAVALIAATLGKPVVISGQTLGPELTEPDSAALQGLLSTATLVGLRDDLSLTLAARLCPGHPGLRRCHDDATILPAAPRSRSRSARRPIVAATFSPATGEVPREEAARAYARLLDHVAAAIGGTVTLLPHQATPGAPDGDVAFHAEVAAHLATLATLSPVRGALETAQRTAEATVAVTNRYHPAVFALAAGVPVLAVAPDQYTAVRFDGAMSTWGVTSQPVPLQSLVEAAREPDVWRDLAARIDAVVADREDQSEALRAARPAVARAHTAWWDDVVAALATPGEAVPAAVTEPGDEVVPPDGSAPRVSVIIPAFNPGPLLGEALMSVRTQTMPAWEAIVVDDGSTEDLSWVDSLDPRVRRIRQDNRGLSAARNRGLDAAQTDLVALLDADDLWHPAKLERQLPLFAEADVALVAADFVEVDAAGRLHGDGYAKEDLSWPSLVRGNGIGVSTVVMRRDVALGLGGFDESLRQAEDWDLWLRIARGHQMAKVPHVLAAYRQHGGQMTRDYMALRANELRVLAKQVGTEAGAPENVALARQAMRTMDRNAGKQAYHRVIRTPLNRPHEAMLHAVRAVRLAPGYVLTRLGARAVRLVRPPDRLLGPPPGGPGTRRPSARSRRAG